MVNFENFVYFPVGDGKGLQKLNAKKRLTLPLIRSLAPTVTRPPMTSTIPNHLNHCSFRFRNMVDRIPAQAYSKWMSFVGSKVAKWFACQTVLVGSSSQFDCVGIGNFIL